MTGEIAGLLGQLADRAALLVWALLGVAVVVGLLLALGVKRKLARDAW